MDTMASRIKNLRIEKGITQDKLGELLGLKKSAVAKYEAGRVKNIKRSTVERMAEIFGCTPSFLLCLEVTDEAKNNNIGRKITYYRKLNNISVEELAERVGEKSEYIKKYEDGEITDIPLETLSNISKELNVNSSELLDWDKPIYISDEDDERAKRIMSYANKLADVNVKITDATICLVKAVDGLTEEQINLLIQMAESLKHRCSDFKIKNDNSIGCHNRQPRKE